jgi:hypothetical protein
LEMGSQELFVHGSLETALLFQPLELELRASCWFSTI